MWQFEREIDLLKFYHPTKVKLDNEITVISDLDGFKYAGDFLIQGTVGQGKSIFLRYLTAIELLKRRSIPLFIELRRIRDSQTLMDHLLQEMVALGLSVSESVFKKICQAGKVILFLDAFDEVGEAHKQRLLLEIEQLAKTYENLRIIVSSRPDSGIQHSPFLRVYGIAPLLEDDYEQVIDKLVQDKTTAEHIKAGARPVTSSARSSQSRLYPAENVGFGRCRATGHL